HRIQPQPDQDREGNERASAGHGIHRSGQECRAECAGRARQIECLRQSAEYRDNGPVRHADPFSRRLTRLSRSNSQFAPREWRLRPHWLYNQRIMADFQVLQPETAYTGAPIAPLPTGLPKTTQSLCPECTQLIAARIFEEGGKVIMEKRCPEHGEFRDVVYSDAKLYLKMEPWTFGDNRGLANPIVGDAA